METFDESRPGLTTPARVAAYDAGNSRELVDDVATEEPLEIRLLAGGGRQNVAVTMRTPGNDFELAAGFLLNEGIVRAQGDIAGISYCTDPAIDGDQRYNIVNVALAARALPDLDRLERHFTMSSACGVCGKASIEALQTRAQPLAGNLQIDAELVTALPQRMRDAQRVFESTGGLHAAALFDEGGTLLALREDVGRHNAVDKIAGWALLHDRIPLSRCILLVSGRASYELVQKSVAAGIPVLCAVSAPSSLAVQLASAFNLTLIGFLRGSRFNVYSARDRVVLAHASTGSA